MLRKNTILITFFHDKGVQVEYHNKTKEKHELTQGT